MVRGQDGLSLYHLGNVVYQSTDFNASYMPDEGDIFLGLPVMSGVHIHGSSKVSFNDIFDNTGENTYINISNALEKLTRQNGVYAHNKVNLFHFGYRLPNRAVISAFVNERVDADFLFTKEAVEYAWEGNGTRLEEDIKVNRLAGNATHFREYGLGLAYLEPRSGIRVGARLKYYQGFFNGSLPWNLKGSARTENENYQLNLDLQNAEFRTSGFDIITGENNHGDLGSHLIGNSNMGFGADFGFEYAINGMYKFALGVNDLGYIKWKENVTHYELTDTTFRYIGADLFGINLIELQDSIADFLDQFQIHDNNKDPYTTVMNPTVYGSITWNAYPGIEVVSTVGTRIVQGEPRFSFGVGGRYSIADFLILSGNVTKLDQQFVNLGAGLAAKVSAFRFYIASDLLIGYKGYSVADMRGVDFRAGLNFVFKSRGRKYSVPTGPSGLGGSSGGYVKSQAQSASGAQKEAGPKSSSFLGQTIKSKGTDGPYTIIKKQKQPKPLTGTSSGPMPQYSKGPKPQKSKKPKFSFKGLAPKWTRSKKPKF